MSTFCGHRIKIKKTPNKNISILMNTNSPLSPIKNIKDILVLPDNPYLGYLEERCQMVLTDFKAKEVVDKIEKCMKQNRGLIKKDHKNYYIDFPTIKENIHINWGYNDEEFIDVDFLFFIAITDLNLSKITDEREYCIGIKIRWMSGFQECSLPYGNITISGKEYKTSYYQGYLNAIAPVRNTVEKFISI